MNLLANQQLASHIAAWAGIPAALTANSPISHSNGNGLDLMGRLTAFADQVRVHEKGLLETLRVDQRILDEFLDRQGQYRLLFWQLPLDWISADRVRATRVLNDMEVLGTSLRSLEKELRTWKDSNGQVHEDREPLTIGRETYHLRRLIASRAGLAEEILSSETDPSEAVALFYDENIRLLRRFDPLCASLEFYHQRRPSWPPKGLKPD